MNTSYSLLERLKQNYITETAEANSYNEEKFKIKQYLTRDIENLLNSRRLNHNFPEEWQELFTSLMHYGIPDVTGKILEAPIDQQKIVESIRQTIANLEPRLDNINIKIIKNSIDYRLHLRINCLTIIKQIKEIIIFDIILNHDDNHFQVKSNCSDR